MDGFGTGLEVMSVIPSFAALVPNCFRRRRDIIRLISLYKPLIVILTLR